VVSVEGTRLSWVVACTPLVLVLVVIALSRLLDPPEPSVGTAPEAVLDAIASVEVEPEPWETPAELAALH
jgi:hypothetical protein